MYVQARTNIDCNRPVKTQELRALAKDESPPQNSSSKLRRKTFDYLYRCMQTVPIATCKVIQLLPSSVGDVVYRYFLLDLLNDIDKTEKCNQFLAIILNGQFSAELIVRFESQILPKFVDALITNDDERIDGQVKLFIGFVDNGKLRDQFVKIDDQLCDCDVNGLITRRRSFVLATAKRQHFVERFIDCEDAAIGRSLLSSNDVLRRTLYLVEVLRNGDRRPNDDATIKVINQFSVSSTRNCFRRNLFNEVQRVLHLKELISSYVPSIQLTAYAYKFNVIDILCEHASLSAIESHALIAILKANQEYNQRLNLCANDETVGRLTELELYNQYLVVKLLLEVIIENSQFVALSDTSAVKLNEVKMLFNQIESVDALTNLLEIAFSLVFVRWDNLTPAVDAHDSGGTADESGSESVRSRKHVNRPEKNAFVCSAVVLENILNLLRNVVASNEAAVGGADSVKKSFCRVRNDINDAHWRVLLLNGTANGRSSFADEDFRNCFGKHKSQAQVNSNGSSDDNESGSQPDTSVCRRKPRKKNHLRRSTDDKNLGISNSTEHEPKSDALHRSMSGSDRRCAVSRLLGSSEHLATVCLNNGNFAATKEIVEVSFYRGGNH